MRRLLAVFCCRDIRGVSYNNQHRLDVLLHKIQNNLAILDHRLLGFLLVLDLATDGHVLKGLFLLTSSFVFLGISELLHRLRLIEGDDVIYNLVFDKRKLLVDGYS